MFKASILKKMFVTVIPLKNVEDVSFEFEFRAVDVPPMDFFEEFYATWFTGPDGQTLLIIFGACVVCFVLLLLCCFCVCIYNCRKKRRMEPLVDPTKIHSIDGKFQQDNPEGDGVDERGVEMKLESLSD